MAEEHGMYKGLAPGERARGVKNNGGLLRRGRASLLCQCCNSKVLSVEKKKKKKKQKTDSSALLSVSHIKVMCIVLGQQVGMALILGHFINK